MAGEVVIITNIMIKQSIGLKKEIVVVVIAILFR